DEIVEREGAEAKSGVLGEGCEQQRRDRHQHQPGTDDDADDQQNVRLTRSLQIQRQVRGPFNGSHVITPRCPLATPSPPPPPGGGGGGGGGGAPLRWA